MNSLEWYWLWWPHRFLMWVGPLLSRVPYPRTQAGDYGEYPVIVSNMLTWEYGIFGIPFGVALENQWSKVPTIVINKAASTLPAEVLEGLLAHEAGHLALGHLEEDNHEVHQLEADRWALERHGQQYIDAMVYLREWHDSEDLQRRLGILKGLIPAIIKLNAC